MKGKPGVRSPAKAKTMVQTAIWLPRDMHERLKNAGGEFGLGEEIRQRLAASITAETADNAATGQLLERISATSDEVDGFYGNWHHDAFVFQIFKTAVNAIMDSFQPAGEVIPTYKPDSLADVLFGTSDTKDIGQRIAALVIHKDKKA